VPVAPQPLRPSAPLTAIALLFAAAPAAAQDLLPAGSAVDGAAVVDITPGGFEAITGALPGLLPSGIAVDPLRDEYEGALGQCWLGGYGYEVSGVDVTLGITDAVIRPANGYLEVTADLEIAVNSASDPFRVWTTLECINSTCDAWVDPFRVGISTWIDMQVIDGPDGKPVLDANIGDISLDLGLSGDQIQLRGCALATINDILDFFGLNLFDIILSFAGGFIDDAVAGFGPEIEALLEDAFSAASIEQEIDLGGATATLQLYPGDVNIQPEGMRLVMDGAVTAGEPATCIQAWDPGGSARVEGDAPAIGDTPADATPGWHAGILLSDEFGNQLLYSIWRAGLLCQTVDEELTGFALNTAILATLAEGGWAELFPTPAPLTILTRPETPPTLDYDGDHDVGLVVDKLGLDFYGDLDHRRTRVVGLDLAVDAGVDLSLDATTGALGVAVALGPENYTTTVSSNDYESGRDAEIVEGFNGLFSALVGPILADQLGALALTLPSIEGLGLTGLDVAGAGDQADWLGIYATLGLVPYTGGGCGEDGGGGCEGGCGVSGRSSGRVALTVLPLALLALRRRRAAR